MILQMTRFARLALAAATVMLSGASVQAQTLTEVMKESIGFLTIRPGVVFVETRSGGSFCKIDVSDQVFSSFADGAFLNDSAFTCVPYDVFDEDFVFSGPRDFTDFIDDSEGYMNIREGVVMVDDGAASSLCQITISDEDFTRFAAQGRSGVQDARAICVHLDELEK